MRQYLWTTSDQLRFLQRVGSYHSPRHNSRGRPNVRLRRLRCLRGYLEAARSAPARRGFDPRPCIRYALSEAARIQGGGRAFR
jgi:hypothetical protein